MPLIARIRVPTLTKMRIKQRVGLLSCFFLIAIANRSECRSTTNEVVLVRTLEPDGMRVYTVDASRLPSKVSWDPAHQQFPVKLNEEMQRASFCLTESKHLTNELGVMSISIERVVIPKSQRLAASLVLDDLADQWFVRFTFFPSDADGPTSAPPQMIHHYVVMLLDGTYATETTAAWHHTDKSPVANDDKAHPRSSAGGASNSVAGGRKPRAVNNPYLRLLSADIPPSAVRWDATRSIFPMDLSAQAARAAAYLAQNYGPMQQPRLHEVVIQPVGMDAMRAHGVPFPEWHSHWVVVFKYEDRNLPVETDDVYMLLDGNIFGSTVR
jgi:hypothetical protein